MPMVPICNFANWDEGSTPGPQKLMLWAFKTAHSNVSDNIILEIRQKHVSPPLLYNHYTIYLLLIFSEYMLRVYYMTENALGAFWFNCQKFLSRRISLSF